MKKSLLLLLLTSGVTLAGCGKKSEFKTAINRSIETDYNCLNLNSSVFVPFMDSKELEQYKKDNDFVIVDEDDVSKPKRSSSHDSEDNDLMRAEALVKAGLLTQTTKREQAMNAASHKPVQSTVFAIHLFNLTKAGKATQKEKHINGVLGVTTQKYTFCYAHPQVDSIVNYSKFDVGGQQFVQVKYSYQLADVADWAKQPEIKSAYPDIKALLDNSDKTAELLLVKTNDGWQSHL